jgi:hypothetical protein
MIEALTVEGSVSFNKALDRFKSTEVIDILPLTC